VAEALLFPVLRLLADGAFRSGEEIARALGVSRANVWYALKNVAETGIALYRVPGRGYRLAERIDWLQPETVMCALGEKSAIFDVHIVDSVDSTNDWLFRALEDGAKSGTVVAAEWQRKGRGRLRRPWHSALGAAITFSLLWKFPRGAASLSGLSLAVGVAVARALKRAGIDDVLLKWPNDVLWREKKLAGILIEVTGDALEPAAVIGIGINFKLDLKIRAAIEQPVCDATEAGCTVGRSLLFAYTLDELAQALPRFSASGFAPFLGEWERHHAYHRKDVTLRMPDGGRVRGRIAGAAPDGSLLLKTRSGLRRFYGGEISLRPE
jgi:BirA family transcriptional regulator, biotin operon repressor / biotin---[acetyl-CoA-carboxylase] ligase